MATTTRRAVLGATGAVIAAGLTGGVPLLGQGRRQGQGPDPAWQELQRQFEALIPQMEQGSAAATLQFAAALRFAAALGEGQQIDAQMKRELRAQKKQKGKSALADALAITLREQHKGQKKRGPDATPAQIEGGLDALERSDVTLPVLWRAIATDLEARAKQMPGIVTVQGWDGTLSGTVVCPQGYMIQVIMWTDLGAAMMCWAAPWACGALALMVAGYTIVTYYTTPSC